jgi:quinoprotein dehydrogenase-associated probable ABC transporter substrate-binding protein
MIRALFGSALASVLAVAGWTAPPPRELRVCADPNNLPFSNDRLEGFENQIAQLVADAMPATLRYTWMPQRRGFIRLTLNANDCDVVIGVPSDYDMVLATEPYYRSTYVFVTAASRHLGLRTFDDPALRTLTIGLHAITEDGANTPPTHALARRGIVGRIVGFKMWDDESVANPAGTVIEAVARGDIDVAIVWGPFAGFFGARQPVALDIVPVAPALDPPFPFVYDVSMGVRRGDAALKGELDGIVGRRRAEIQRILETFRIPLVPERGK